jgi:phage terminase large subunit-like protein
MGKITIPYKPRNWAKELHDSTKRWKVLVLHRRAGKTTAVLNHLQRDALRNPNAEYAYIAPTYKQAKRIAWKLIKFYSNCIPGIDYNESELIVKYPNGSTLSLYGSDNVDALRGIGLRWAIPQKDDN